MTCSDFLDGYTCFIDGDLSAEEAEYCSRHIAICHRCRRYHEVLSRGVELLKSLPSTEPTDDFRARLQHSVYTLREEDRRRRLPRTGPGAMSLFAMAAVIAAVILTPLVREPDRSVDLPPIVVQGPTARGLTIIPEPTPVVPVSEPFSDRELWARSNALLYEHSSLYARYREPGLIRAGLR